MSAQEIWEEFSQRLKLFIFKRTRNEQDAEDILQNVFYKIQTHLHQLRDEERLEFWLYRITRNAINDFYRVHDHKIDSVDDLENIRGESHSAVSIQEIGSCLRPMIDHMPQRYSQALTLTELEGWTQEAMAEKLNLSWSGAKSRVQRGKAMLKDMLLEGCNLEFDHLGFLSNCSPKRKAG